MSANEMHAIKLAYPFATLGINVQKPKRSHLDETHLELPRHLLFSVFFFYNQLVLLLFPLLPSLFEFKRHVLFFVGPRLVQSEQRREKGKEKEYELVVKEKDGEQQVSGK